MLSFLGGLALLALGIFVLRALIVFDASNVAMLSVVLGLLNIVVGYGLWVGKSWAWYLGILSGALVVIYSVWSMMPIPLVIDAVIVAYLLRSKIQRYFKVHIGWSW